MIYLTHYKPRSAFRMYLNNSYVQSGWSDLGFRLNGVRRGGYNGINYQANSCRSGYRYTRNKGDAINAIGFRCVNGVNRGGVYSSLADRSMCSYRGYWGNTLDSVSVGRGFLCEWCI